MTFPSQGFGQNGKTDSLLTQTYFSFDRFELAGLYAELSWHYRKSNADSALFFAEACIDLSKELENDSLLAVGKERKGIAFQKLGQWQKALSAFYEALAIREEHQWWIGMARTHVDLGNTLLYQGELEDRNGDSTVAAEYFSKAMVEYELARNLAKKVDSRLWTAISLFSIGNVWYYRYEDNKAKTHYRQSLKIYREIGDKNRQMTVLANIGVIYEGEGKLDSARYLYELSLHQFQQSGDLRGQIGCEINLAELSKKVKASEIAIEHLLKADSLAKKVGERKRQAEIQENLAATYAGMGEYETALHHQSEFIRINHEILNLETVAEMENLRVKYQTAKKEKENAQLLNRQKILMTGLIILGLVLLVGIFYFLYYRARQLSVRLRDQQKINDMLLEQDKRLINAMLDGQEKERQRIAGDLHDRMGSILSAIKLYFGNLSQDLKTVDERSLKNFTKTEDLLEKAIVELRSISKNLVSGVLLDFGLEPALKELTQTINLVGGVKVELGIFGLDERLPSRLEISVFRISQELLTNALKHARASKIVVSVLLNDDFLDLRIMDDGKGFEWTDSTNGKGLGLKSVQKRVEALGGSLIPQTGPGKGTSYHIKIPMKDYENDNPTPTG